MAITKTDCDRNVHWFWEKAKKAEHEGHPKEQQRCLAGVDEWLDMRLFLDDFSEGGVTIDERGIREVPT